MPNIRWSPEPIPRIVVVQVLDARFFRYGLILETIALYSAAAKVVLVCELTACAPVIKLWWLRDLESVRRRKSERESRISTDNQALRNEENLLPARRHREEGRKGRRKDKWDQGE